MPIKRKLKTSTKFKVSVVTPTRNRSKLLEKCLASLTSQTIRPHEIIIVDNNSTDNTKKIISKYKSRIDIKYIYLNQGTYPEFYNSGIYQASGQIIAFLDDDCIADKNWVRNTIIAHNKYPNSIIQGYTTSLPKGNIYAQIMGSHYLCWLEGNFISKNHLRVLDNKNASGPTSIIKKYKFSKDMSRGSEDIELAKRLLRDGIPIIYYPKVKAFHHERDTLKGFLIQHLRIAISESYLDKQLSADEKINMILNKKNLLIVKSFIKTQFKFLRKLDVFSSLYLTFLYFLLIVVRFYGYSK